MYISANYMQGSYYQDCEKLCGFMQNFVQIITCVKIKTYNGNNLKIRTYLAPCDLPAWPSDSLQSQNTSGLYPVSSAGRRTDLHLLDGLRWLKVTKIE